jgi:hypothetical protein
LLCAKNWRQSRRKSKYRKKEILARLVTSALLVLPAPLVRRVSQGQKVHLARLVRKASLVTSALSVLWARKARKVHLEYKD